MAADEEQLAADSSDDELDWEEVHVPEQQLDAMELEISESTPPQNIEITLQARPKKDESKKKVAAALRAQRLLRTTSHKIHTVALLANARVRNKWLNDELLHARLLSITPLSLQNGFAMIHKSRVPDQNKRGRLFEASVNRLVDWWSGTYFSIVPTGHIKSRTFEEVEAEDTTQNGEPDTTGSELIRSAESLMKHVLMQSGSRDTSAQLFTALCRALDIPARLVVSLQSVPWKSKPAAKGTPKGKGKAPQRPSDDQKDPASDEHSEMEEVPIPSDYKGKGKEKANPNIRLRKQKSQSTSRSRSSTVGARSLKSPDPTTTPPVFWTEVFSRADSRWLPVDPIRGIVNKRNLFDPSTAQNPGAKTSVKQENRMLYVIGLEEDGFGRDITARYARDYTAKVSKVQGVGAGPTNGRKEWWARVVQSITRPYRLQRDDLEDDELHIHQLTEGMPTTIAGFKNHPLYALSRHLKRDEVIDPPTELGKFRGEPVYPRSSVISLKTAENWMRQGRIIRQGCQPMKMVKQRAVTVGRQREMELALERAREEGPSGGDQEVMQGLYALSQTELYKPSPIKDGKIPKNDFGNIDLYVPSMLPQGAVHIPFKGAAKIAKKLGFDYAEAVTGFEFRKRRAIPVIQGIVVAAKHENVIVDACLEAEQDAEEKARTKRLEQVCKRWVRLVQGLRIRDRLQKEYATSTEQEPVLQQERPHWLDTEGTDANGHEQLGGYLTTADDVVQPFQLPRDLHRPSAVTIDGDDRPDNEEPVAQHALSVRAESLPRDLDLPLASTGQVEMEVESIDDSFPPQLQVETQPIKGPPKTMRELAEYDAQRAFAAQQKDTSDRVGSESRTGVPEEDRGSRSGRRSEGPGPSGRTRTSRTARTSKKRTRKRSESTSDADVDTSPPKRRQVSTTPASQPAPGRVLRPRAQKSAARVLEESEMEEAIRRAIAD